MNTYLLKIENTLNIAHNLGPGTLWVEYEFDKMKGILGEKCTIQSIKLDKEFPEFHGHSDTETTYLAEVTVLNDGQIGFSLNKLINELNEQLKTQATGYTITKYKKDSGYGSGNWTELNSTFRFSDDEMESSTKPFGSNPYEKSVQSSSSHGTYGFPTPPQPSSFGFGTHSSFFSSPFSNNPESTFNPTSSMNSFAASHPGLYNPEVDTQPTSFNDHFGNQPYSSFNSNSPMGHYILSHAGVYNPNSTIDDLPNLSLPIYPKKPFGPPTMY